MKLSCGSNPFKTNFNCGVIKKGDHYCFVLKIFNTMESDDEIVVNIPISENEFDGLYYGNHVFCMLFQLCKLKEILDKDLYERCDLKAIIKFVAEQLDQN